jgi:membrane dipeptidase
MTKSKYLFVLLMAGFAACQTPKEAQKDITFDEGLLKKADSLAHANIITDGHVDLPYHLRSGNNVHLINKENGDALVIDSKDGDFDYKRSKEGGLDAPYMSIYIPASYQEEGGAKELADSLINLVGSMAETYPEKYALAGSPQEVEKNFKEGKISLPMGMENGAPIEDKLENVQYFFERGIRYITLCHSKDNLISDSSYDTARTHNGLSEFGVEVIKEMNRTGIMVDVSHISDSAFYDVMEVTEAPVIASHSSCRHFTPGFERNMSDELIKALAANGGVVQINFGSTFMDSVSIASKNQRNADIGKLFEENNLKGDEPEARELVEAYNKENPFKYTDVYRAADHIDHVVNLVGIDHVGFGSDFDGVGDTLPVGLKDVSDFPKLIAVLLQRGYSDEDIAKICYKNVFRVWNQVLEHAQQQQEQQVM